MITQTNWKGVLPMSTFTTCHFQDFAPSIDIKCFIFFQPLGWIIFLLTGGKTISTHLNYIEITHFSMEIYLKWNIWGVQPSKYRLCMPNQPCYVPVWHMHLETSSLSYKCNTQNKVHKFICWKFWLLTTVVLYVWHFYIPKKHVAHILYSSMPQSLFLTKLFDDFDLLIMLWLFNWEHDYFTFLIFPFKWPSPILLQKKIFS